MPDPGADLPDDEFENVIDAASRGSGAAMDELVRSVDRRLVGFLRSRGAEDPEGTANEVLVQVCRSIGTFEGNQAQFRAWVFTMARNRLIDEHRKAGRRVRSDPTAPHELAHQAGSFELDADVEHDERMAAMLSCLTDEQREVVLLRIVAGLSVDETARALGRRPGAVRALQHRALRQLRSQLVEES